MLLLVQYTIMFASVLSLVALGGDFSFGKVREYKKCA